MVNGLIDRKLKKKEEVGEDRGQSNTGTGQHRAMDGRIVDQLPDKGGGW